MEHDAKVEEGDEGFAEGDSQQDMTMEYAPVVDDEDELLEGPRVNTVYYAIPMASAETEKQGKDFTKDEVEEMMKSEPYQRKIDTCHLCGKCWYDGCCSSDCQECDGFCLVRPCPICNGQCNQIWKRNVRTSHSYHKAQWDGHCELPQELQQAYILRSVDSSEKMLTEGMQDLSTD